VAAYCVKSVAMYILCAVQNETELVSSCTAHSIYILTIVTLARPKYKVPDDGHRLKHVAAF